MSNSIHGHTMARHLGLREKGKHKEEEVVVAEEEEQ
jgi:hypothetical protein